MAVSSNLKEFVKFLALDKFNTQFTREYTVDQFDAKLIESNVYSKFAFEVFSTSFETVLRLRLYFTIADRAFIGEYKYESISNQGTGLGDEVFVADGYIDEAFLRVNNNEIRQSLTEMGIDETLLNVLLCEDGINAIVAGNSDDYLDLSFT